ncbi:MAG: DUF6263 family protein [Phycisphaerae bacterium]
MFLLSTDHRMQEHKQLRNAITVLFVSAHLVLPATVRAADETFTIQPTFAAGTDYVEWKREGTIKTGANPMGPEKTVPTLQLRGMKREVKSDAKGAAISLTFDRLKFTVDTMRGPVNFDSDTDMKPAPQNPLQFVAGPALGQSITMTVNPSTRAATLTGMDDLSLAIEEKAAGKFIFEPLMPDFTDDAAMFDWIDTQFAPCPSRPVKRGESWKTTIRHEHLGMGTLDLAYECQLKSVEKVEGRNVATITYKGKITKPGNGRPGYRVFNTKLNFKDGHFDGEAQFDLQRGEFIDHSMHTHIDAEAVMLLSSIDEPAVFEQVFDYTTTVKAMPMKDRKEQRSKAATSKAE